MIKAEEPFHPSVCTTVTLAGIERNWGYGLAFPGAALFFAGLIGLRLGWILGGIALIVGLVGPAAIACRGNPHFLSDLCLAAMDWFFGGDRIVVPEPGLRGKDGI